MLKKIYYYYLTYTIPIRRTKVIILYFLKVAYFFIKLHLLLSFEDIVVGWSLLIKLLDITIKILKYNLSLGFCVLICFHHFFISVNVE